ncbi:MAG TPA: nucleotidyltransferase domain-containing protein [Chthonomonadales bacterium]|nr:nucleotidyltransferase domain-containing protein [Chthonomonadales bacterium]
MNARGDIAREADTELCRRWRVQPMWLFGSGLREDFGAQSDVDVVVEAAPYARWSLLGLVGAEQELATILVRPVDLVDRQCVEQSDNTIRRRHTPDSAITLYVA